MKRTLVFVGYAEFVAQRLRALNPRTQLVNYSCPGESTRSYVTPCIWRASGRELHDDYAGAQRDAALTFLSGHRGQVSPITVSLNGNDINDFLATCPPGDLACLQASAAASVRARFADPFPVFNPAGGDEVETAAICALTLICTAGDGHPSDAGYQALADVVWP